MATMSQLVLLCTQLGHLTCLNRSVRHSPAADAPPCDKGMSTDMTKGERLTGGKP